jgi:hypothetical protein
MGGQTSNENVFVPRSDLVVNLHKKNQRNPTLFLFRPPNSGSQPNHRAFWDV